MHKPLLKHLILFSLGLSSLCCGTCVMGQASAPASPPDASSPQYLGDRPELILLSSQAWGELGLNVAAHASDTTGLPLQIGEKIYAKGLGHHANGSIEVLLEGEYAGFDAELGIQPCGAGGINPALGPAACGPQKRSGLRPRRARAGNASADQGRARQLQPLRALPRQKQHCFWKRRPAGAPGVCGPGADANR